MAERTRAAEVAGLAGKSVSVAGWAESIRALGDLTFVVLRDGSGSVQIKFEKSKAGFLDGLLEQSVIRVTGKVVSDDRAPGGVEIQGESCEVISAVTEEPPLVLSKKELTANPDTIYDHRSLSLRHKTVAPVFRIQQAIAQTFSRYFTAEGFTEIHTPKIVAAGAEGGAEIFEIKYFDQKAYLTQSPQLYKQMMVGVFERVFEIGYAYRAEQHNTSRHLNEYVSLDLEMGFINDYAEIMQLETGFLKQVMKDLTEKYQAELVALRVTLPTVPDEIPTFRLEEAQEIIEKKFGKEGIVGKDDLDPEEEQLICKHSTEELDSEFVFITHYPSSKRPFYAYDDPADPKHTNSFDLLFRGLEVTTGGQRLHRYEDYIAKMTKRKMDPAKFGAYLETFKFGMPPHGGLAIGLERLTMKLLNLSNVREASLFPRDRNRLTP